MALEIVDFGTNILSILTLIGTIYVIIAFLFFILRRKFPIKFVNENSLALIFIVSLIATLGSLFFSEIAGFTPCKLCWYQRILMYPLVLISIIALYKKDNNVIKYIIPMSIIGGLIAAYHYLLQIGIITTNLPCSTVGYSASCTEFFILEYGYITIPMMSLVAFLMIIFLSYNIHEEK